MDTWVDSVSWLLWIMLQWTWAIPLQHADSISFGYTPSSGITGSYGSVFLTFEKVFFPILATLFPPIVCKDFLFSTLSPTLVIFYCHSNRSAVTSHCWAGLGRCWAKDTKLQLDKCNKLKDLLCSIVTKVSDAIFCWYIRLAKTIFSQIFYKMFMI